MSTSDGAPRICRLASCGRPLPPPPLADQREERRYCGPLCRSRAQRLREKEANRAKHRPAPPPRRFLCVCQWSKCGRRFEGASPDTRFCSGHCRDLAHYETHRLSLNPARRHAAERTALRRAHTERCPGCAAQLGAEGPLLFCRARCGWSELLTAHERAPDAPPPKDAPMPRRLRAAVATPTPVEPLPVADQVLAALDEPQTLDQLVALTYLPRATVVQALSDLWTARRVQVVDGLWSRWGQS